MPDPKLVWLTISLMSGQSGFLQTLPLPDVVGLGSANRLLD